MSLTEYTGAVSLVGDARYMASIPATAVQLAKSGMCPLSFKNKPDEIAIVGQSLAELGLRLNLLSLKQAYVVHGAAGWMAQFQIMLAARFGCPIVPLDEESDDTVAYCDAWGKDQRYHRIRFTMAMAEKAGLLKPKVKEGKTTPSMYVTWPERMLAARVVTKAIDMHCPEAKLLLPPGDQLEMAAVRAVDPDTGEIAGIPATDRERRRLSTLLASLDPEAVARVKAAWVDAGLPPARHPDLTSTHVAAAEDLIYRTIDARDAAVVSPPCNDDVVVDAEVMPAGAHDDAPEAGVEDPYADEPGFEETA